MMPSVADDAAFAAIAMMARTMLGLVFLQGFATKLADPARLAGTIADYRLLPAALARPASLLLLAVEGLVALLLLAANVAPAQMAPLGAGIAALLLALFVAAMAINLRRGRRHISCGCHAEPTPLSWSRVGLSASLLVAACPAALPYAPQPIPLSLQAATGGVLLWAMFQTGGSLLRPRLAAGR